MPLTPQEKIKAYKTRQIVAHKIREFARRRQLELFGRKAINFHVKEFMKVHSTDWDFYHKNPARIIKKLEAELENFLQGNYYRIKKSKKHPTTYKLISNTTNQSVVDISRGDIETQNIQGMKVATKSWLKHKIQKTLKKKSAEHRWKKERENLQRLELSESRVKNNKSFLLNPLPFVSKPTKKRSRVDLNDFSLEKKKKNGGKPKISLW